MSRQRLNLRIRFGILALWAAILLWLPVEDTNFTNARILAILACSLLAVRVFLRFKEDRLLVRAALGLLAGLLVNPLTTGLMILKTGLHGHSAPDFSVADLAKTLSAIPVYSLAGVLIGAGLYFLGKTD